MSCFSNRQWFTPGPRAVAMLCFVALAAQAQTQKPKDASAGRSDHDVVTVHGHLDIQQVEQSNGRTEFQFTLDGKQVGADLGYSSVSIQESYPAKGPARLVLLLLLTGGSGCPGFFKVLEVKDDGGILLSEEFGNCFPGVRSRFSKGVLRLDIPKMGGAEAQSWRYQDGRLTAVKRGSSK